MNLPAGRGGHWGWCLTRGIRFNAMAAARGRDLHRWPLSGDRVAGVMRMMGQPRSAVLRLVECYIESDRMPEAKALIDRLGLPEDDDLVGRANQMMLDAPNSASEKSDAALRTPETKRIDEEGSVLGEFFFFNGSLGFRWRLMATR